MDDHVSEGRNKPLREELPAIFKKYQFNNSNLSEKREKCLCLPEEVAHCRHFPAFTFDCHQLLYAHLNPMLMLKYFCMPFLTSYIISFLTSLQMHSYLCKMYPKQNSIMSLEGILYEREP